MRSFGLIFFSLFFFVSSCYLISAQEDCKVLIPELQGEYEGKCKKGLAHGKGVARGIDTYEGNFREGLPNRKGRYEWNTGEIYDGEWKKGVRNGEGKYMYKKNNRDTTIAGLWEEDRYIGPVPEKPKVIRKFNLDRVSFYRQGDGAKVEITFYQGGNMVSNLGNFMMVGSSGTEYSVGKAVGFDNVNFPFTCNINYSIQNYFRTQVFNCDLEFEINQPGHWIVKVHNL